MQQRMGRIGTCVALLLVGSGLSLEARQAGPETEAVIRTSVDQHFALMPESWRQEFSRRLAGRLDNPRVAASTRTAILKDCDRLIDTEATPLMLIQNAASVFPAAAPPESLLEEGARTCATAIEGVVRNAVLYAPLRDEERAARRSDLKTFERQAMRILHERIVGDDRVRGVVADRVAELFRFYAEAIGSPTQPFLNRALPPDTLREIVEDMERSFPREKKLLVTGLSGDRDADAQKLREQGVDDLIDGVVVRKIYFTLHRASWADPAALKEVMTAEEQLWDWRGKVREQILQKARQQKLDEARLLEALGPASRTRRPVAKKEEPESAGPPPLRSDPPQARNGAATTETATSSRSRWPVLAVGAALLAVFLMLLRKRPKPA